jgi:sulfide:quinone oxidoreductase
MITDSSPNITIVGGGVAALEGALALRDLTQGRANLQIVSASNEFVYRPMTVREPFAFPPAHRYSLEQIADDIGATLIVDRFAWVDAANHVAHTESGRSLAYDALLLGLGARMRAPLEHATTIDDARMDGLLHGVIEDVEGGYLRRIAFVATGRVGWPLPLYELALQTARRAYDAGVEVEISLVTPEERPLAIFGPAVSTAVAELLDEAGVRFVAPVYARMPDKNHLELSPGGRRLTVDRVIALPELFGPAVRGLPAAEHGFIPVDDHAAVRGVADVYAAGDATDCALKFGGIAAQQADAAAQQIASRAGAPVSPRPFRPEMHGMLLTGGQPRYISARITGGRGFSSEISDTAPADHSAKIAASYLAPYLERLDHAGVA